MTSDDAGGRLRLFGSTDESEGGRCPDLVSPAPLDANGEADALARLDQNEQLVLAAFDELIADGIVYRVNDDGSAACGFQSHRGSEYVDAAGRVTCGICHPDPRKRGGG